MLGVILERVADASSLSAQLIPTDSTALQEIRHLPWGEGLDASTEEYVDLVKAGIVDPVKVVRSALQNAASIANMVLSTEVVIVEKPEKKSGMPAGGGEDYDY